MRSTLPSQPQDTTRKSFFMMSPPPQQQGGYIQCKPNKGQSLEQTQGWQRTVTTPEKESRTQELNIHMHYFVQKKNLKSASWWPGDFPQQRCKVCQLILTKNREILTRIGGSCRWFKVTVTRVQVGNSQKAVTMSLFTEY